MAAWLKAVSVLVEMNTNGCDLCVFHFNILALCFNFPFNQDDAEKGMPEDSLTSTEFERFLAERAAAADNLPNISNASEATSKTTPKKSSTSKKTEDSLLLQR